MPDKQGEIKTNFADWWITYLCYTEEILCASNNNRQN